LSSNYNVLREFVIIIVRQRERLEEVVFAKTPIKGFQEIKKCPIIHRNKLEANIFGV